MCQKAWVFRPQNQYTSQGYGYLVVPEFPVKSIDRKARQGNPDLNSSGSWLFQGQHSPKKQTIHNLPIARLQQVQSGNWKQEDTYNNNSWWAWEIQAKIRYREPSADAQRNHTGFAWKNSFSRYLSRQHESFLHMARYFGTFMAKQNKQAISLPTQPGLAGRYRDGTYVLLASWWWNTHDVSLPEPATDQA